MEAIAHEINAYDVVALQEVCHSNCYKPLGIIHTSVETGSASLTQMTH